MRKCLFILLLIFVGNTHASFIVDTGPGSNATGGVTLDSSQYLAGIFTTAETYSITSAEGWIGKGRFDDDGTYTAVLYTNSISNLPGTDIFTHQFLADKSTVAENAWEGAFGLNWTIDPGTYWLAIEARVGDTGSGYMPSGAPKPLINYAFNDTRTPGWSLTGSSLSIGMRIEGTIVPVPVPVPVPAPPALLLFGTGIIGLIGFSKRRKAA